MEKIIDWVKAHKEGTMFAASAVICVLSFIIQIAGIAAAAVLVYFTGADFLKKVLGR